MRISDSHRRTLLFAAAIAAMVGASPGAVSAEDKIYPPGTDCANQPTIAERLLCGRQEYRRQHGISVQQPEQVPPAPQDEGQVFPETPTAPMDVRPSPREQEQLPRTSSPNN